MPNPTFMPVIGRDFGDIANQQRSWAGFNQSVDEGNIARLAQAQQVQNNWLARASELRDAAQRRDEDLQLSADAQAREDAARRTSQAIQGSQFGQSLEAQRAEARARVTAEENRTAAMTQKDKDTLARQLATQSETISNLGVDHASNYGLLESEKKSAEAEFADANQKLAEAHAKRLADPTKVTLSDIKDLQTIQGNAAKALNTARNKLTYERLRIEGKKFQVSDANGYILHPETGLKFPFREPAATAPVPPPAPWAGFQGTTKLWPIGGETTPTDSTGTTPPADLVPPQETETGTAPAPGFIPKTKADSDEAIRQAWETYQRAPSQVREIRKRLHQMFPNITDDQLDNAGFK